MKVKFGALVVDGRGKLGGHVASKNRAGAYLRTKVTPVNPESSDQGESRNRFAGLSQAWRGLTQAQRDSWNSSVDAFASTDVFGDLKNPTGFNLYQQLNNNLAISGEAGISVPPAPAAVEATIVDGFSLVIAASVMLLDLSGPDTGNSILKIFATPAMSAGIANPNSKYRLIDEISNDVATHSITTKWLAKFGSFPTLGTKVFVKIQVINIETGQVGSFSSVSAITIAA